LTTRTPSAKIAELKHRQGKKAMNTENPKTTTSNIKTLKPQLVTSIIAIIKAKKWTQVVAAKHLGVSPPRLSNLMKGHLEKFSVDMLIGMLARLGCSISVTLHTSMSDHPVLINKMVAA
jgi:predicted XRE-type DNA-binding protein